MSCILQNSVIDQDVPMAVVAHDAGAANLIFGWISEGQRNNLKFYVSGPAKDILSELQPFIQSADIDSVLKDVKYLISGTSSSEINLEHEARLQAKHLGIPSVGVIDHWVNYKQRFVRHGQLVLPDEIWVSDEYALSIACECFPDSRIRLISNYFFGSEVQSIRDKSTQSSSLKSLNVLYLLEPFKEDWGCQVAPAEMQALDFFIEYKNLLGIYDDAKILLRPHPSEASDKYNNWCHTHKELDVSVDSVSTLSDLIAWSDVVVGCQTAAMVIALQAGRRVVSVMPPWAPPCILPHDGIEKLSDFFKG